MLDTIVEGTRRVLDFAVRERRETVLFTSSGAVYGPQPRECRHMPETYAGGPDLTDQRNGLRRGQARRRDVVHGLRAAVGTSQCVPRGVRLRRPVSSARRALRDRQFHPRPADGRPIRVNGDGTRGRSYLYAADLAIWLWTILVAGAPGRPYNVGSERAVSIAELARMVAGDGVVEIAGTPAAGGLPERYVPSCERARTELNLTEQIPLEEAICRTMASFTR